MERDEVPHEHQVEELSQVPLTLGAHLDDVSYDLSKHIRDEGEAPGQLGMLGVVAQIDEGDDLAGDVPVLAPAGDLVVTELGVDRGEGGRLGVLVDLRLPSERGGGADGLGAVHEGN